MFRVPPAGEPEDALQKRRVSEPNPPPQDSPLQNRTPKSHARPRQSAAERSDSSGQPLRRRKTRCSRACEPCRERKVRCIVNSSIPCERCKATDAKCIIRQRFVGNAFLNNYPLCKPSKSLREHAEPRGMAASSGFPSTKSGTSPVGPAEEMLDKSDISYQADPRVEIHPEPHARPLQLLDSDFKSTSAEGTPSPKSTQEIASYLHLRSSVTSAQASRVTRHVLERLDSEILTLSGVTLRQSLLRQLMSQVRILINSLRQIESLGAVGAITDPSLGYWEPTSQRHGAWADSVEEIDRRSKILDNSQQWASIEMDRFGNFLSGNDPGYESGAVGPGSRNSADLGTAPEELHRTESSASAEDQAPCLQDGLWELLDEFINPTPPPISEPVSRPKSRRGGYGVSGPDDGWGFWS
ncbi:Zn(II)2Cys6 transcription factor domain-containing protein [Aspergillus thermomutatus]|uniref:Zn(2)-C6 fungal-type domain-containing protein n=1 Tax=Aspergillus thermomutatus TaxID=41047 RepID=A0A397HTR3_ASPTH|nr:uncharacterized protein CDV56_109447 [Aspergillus thermomutatus]RHZ64966.1 hypothetical protein CDV56_109447 [Aspergillus thermomutatus]